MKLGDNSIKMITIFGASGRTGKEVAIEAHKHGIEVRTFDKKAPLPEELHQAVRGTDAVAIVFGPNPPYTDIFCAKTTKDIITAMETENVSRLICQTGAMIGNYPQNRSFFFEMFGGKFRKSNPQGYDDRVQQEEAVKTSSLKWTIIKPPRLTEAETDKEIRAGEGVKVGLLSSVSRKSLARFIISELITPRYVYQAIFVKD